MGANVFLQTNDTVLLGFFDVKQWLNLEKVVGPPGLEPGGVG